MAEIQHAHGARGIPQATIARLPVYLRVLDRLADEGCRTVSSGELAAVAGVNSAQLRKDLSFFGSYGVRGVGYAVDHLRGQIARHIGSAQRWPVIIVGMGNLGTALANYSRHVDPGALAGERGFDVVAAVDVDPELVGRRLTLRDGAELAIQSLDDLELILATSRIAIGVITTPADDAQAVCDRLVAGGVSSILNFAAVPLQAPAHVVVRKVDLGQELQILAYHAHQVVGL